MDTDNKTFLIPAYNLELLSTKIEAMNRRAKKLGAPEILTHVLGVETHQISVAAGEDEAGRPLFKKFPQKFYSILVDGIAPKLDGEWTFVGTLEHTDAGNITRAIPGQSIPESFRKAPKVCDHCSKIRSRKDIYILKNSAGEYKQIGRQCMKDFLGHTSPERIAFLASLLESFKELQSYSERRESKIILIQDFMEMAAECVIRNGFVSRSAVKAYADKVAESGGRGGLVATVDLTWFHLFPTAEMIRKDEAYSISDEAVALTSASLEYAKGLTETSEYSYNLRTTAHKEQVERRDGGLLASAISAYQKHLGKVTEYKSKQAAFANSKPFGTVGKREIFTLTVIGEHVLGSSNFGGYYGSDENRILYRLQDAQGNVAVWFTTGSKLEVGQTYRLKATVKEHSAYKDIQQTMLARVVNEDAKDREREAAQVLKSAAINNEGKVDNG